VVIASAFGAIVTSLVNDIITPLILNPALKAAKVERIAQLSWHGVGYGNFLSAIINFIFVGTALFFIIKGIEKAQKLTFSRPFFSISFFTNSGICKSSDSAKMFFVSSEGTNSSKVSSSGRNSLNS
ncbi:large conductance mechanosensitive channel protein MscL, partial [Streptococcus pneumoniae]|uniref:large conductance mechanosensitive channel protein MscL n=1 Tax=Streptococcus pneumoniae TaxID=1313 RepID=UPI003453A0C2